MNTLHAIKPAIDEDLMICAIGVRSEHPGLIVRVNQDKVQYRWAEFEPWETIFRHQAYELRGRRVIQSGRDAEHRKAIMEASQ